MSSTIVIKNSSTASSIPATGDLVQGELAVNVTDKKIYTKNSAGAIVVVSDVTGAAASATSAASSATAASTSATNAATSATAASTSATNAATAKTAAEAARDATLAAYDSFDDRYLGAKTSDPTLDNDGNALVAGSLYFNSSTQVMKLYTGSAWVAAYVSGADFVAKAGDTMTGTLVVPTIVAGGGSVLSGATNPIVAMTKGAAGYIQSYIINNTNGASSSADFVAYPNNGTDTSGWVDMGVTSQTYADATYTVTGPNEAYLFGSAPSGAGKTGNLVYATDSTGSANAHQWYVGGFTQAKSAWKMQLTATQLQLANTLSPLGTSSTLGAIFLDSGETVNVVGSAPSATTNLYVQSGSVQYYTTNAANNFVVNLAFSSGTSMNTALSTGQSVTAALITTQGSTAYYGTSIQVDGTTTGVTTKWIGGAPAAGNASGLDVYRFAVIKTASATYTVLASLTQYK